MYNDARTLDYVLMTKNMNTFQKAKATFDYTPFQKEIASLEEIRKQFVAYFNEEKLRHMKIEEYAIGNGVKDWHCFCYGLERTFDRLGCILGATSMKFGIFYSPTHEQYRWASRFGDTKVKAFNKVKKCILELLEYGANDDIDGIATNILSPMMKGKILSIYYPEKYLNIFSDEHLSYYLMKLGLDNDDILNSKPVYKRQRLVDFKNSDPDLKSWPMNKFATFLYAWYPKAPNAEKGDEPDDILDTTTTTYTVDAKLVEMEFKHKEMQNALKPILLAEGYDKVYLEKDCVDVKAFTKYGQKHFFELKVYSAKESIREALGQILEYAHYPQNTKAKKLFIVSPEPPTEDDRNYMEFLRETYKLPVWFRYYSFEENKLYPEI